MSVHVDFLPRQGELAGVIRSHDWSATPVGPPETWPPSLRNVLRLMLSSRYAMWLGWGPELSFFYNDAYARQTLGAKHPGVLGQPFREVWAEIWDTLSPRIEHVLRTGEATWDEGLLLFLERNGYPEETYHTFSYSPAPADGPDQIAGLFCVVIEETDRVIGERRIALLRDLASSLARSKRAHEVLASLEACLDADARDLTFSLTYLFEDDGKSARRASQTGFAAGDPDAPERMVVRGPAAVPWPLEAVLAGGEPVVIELPPGRAWPSGAWQRPPTRAIALPIGQPGDGRPAGVFVAGLNPHRPLDEGLRSHVGLMVGQLAASLSNASAYEETRKRAEALAELDRAKTAFFSNVSHEFRTPLTLMLGPTEDALSSPERALRGDELETVHRNELRLLKLVNGLLDFARIEAGRIQASYERTDLSALTSDLASTFRSAVERAGLEFEVRCAPLPEPIYVDHDMWEKIVLNLLSNALKFTFEGRIGVVLTWCGDHVELTVEDTGVGIAARELPRLFERFYRVEGTRARTHEGSGIGLALVHELVRLHGGTIRVTSAVGEGSTFTLSIPRGLAHLPAERIGAARTLSSTSAGEAYLQEALEWLPGRASTEPQAPQAPREGQARILVADDNADMRGYIARLLRQHWVVEVVADGAEALEAARRSSFDLVLSDVMMPRLDGFGLVRELRGDPRTASTPVVLLSARAGEEATAEGLRAGADDYLVKPFSASALLVRVEAQLSAARLRASQRLAAEAERARLESMFRESPAAMCLLRGPSLVIELANPHILKLWGRTADVLGMPLMEALPDLRGQGFDDLLRGVLQSGVAHHGTEVVAQFQGEQSGSPRQVYADFVYAPLPGADGRPDAVFVHAYDVTDKVVARRNAEAANRVKDEFLATVSHELRTPLNAILGWATLLRSGADDARSRERALATIERNARTQARLIEDVLDVSRIISGKLRIDTVRVDVCAIARAAIDVVRPAAEAKRVHLVVDLPPEEHLELVGDADRLQQVLWNLLINAVKFTPAGGAVSLTVERDGSAARLIVRDTGCGLAREDLPYVFERFRQVDSSSTRQHGGLGLGLAIVRHLVELHGGSVTAESPGPGQGATFTVRLPIRALHGEPEAQPEHRRRDGRGEPSSSPPRLEGVSVLVVDDDEDACTLLDSALGRAGATVHLVPSAAAAMAFLDRHSVDVVVSDVGMPDEDGFSLIRRIRRLPAARGGQVPAIALTAYARAEDVTRAREAGYELHLTKPADLDALTRAVGQLAAGELDPQERSTPESDLQAGPRDP